MLNPQIKKKQKPTVGFKLKTEVFFACFIQHTKATRYENKDQTTLKTVYPEESYVYVSIT